MDKDVDAQFLCKDCARYNLCEHYHRRKKDSYICKYFHLSEAHEMPNGQDPCEDCISRQALRQSLQGHRDFFVTSYGSYKDMTPKEKVRVDEIDNCIARVVNAPPVTPQPKTGHWIEVETNMYACSNCGHCFSIVLEDNSIKQYKYCPNCKCSMVKPQESED